MTLFTIFSTQNNNFTMPLVVPGINSTSGDNAEEWQNKLVGKKLSESESNETVSSSL